MNRAVLPLRRAHEAFHFWHWQQKFIAGIGRATPNAPISEVWINTGKSGTQAETLARDSAVLISLGLQYGVPLAAMQKAIMRDADGQPSGPIGKLLDLITDDEKEPEGELGLPHAPVSGAPALEPTI